MRFLVDSCAGRTVARALEAANHDVEFVPDLGTDPGDEAILQRACTSGRILITMDTDFGRLVFLLGKPHAGVIRLRPMPPEQRIKVLLSILEAVEADTLTNSLITAYPDHYRIRHQ